MNKLNIKKVKETYQTGNEILEYDITDIQVICKTTYTRRYIKYLIYGINISKTKKE